MVSRRRSFVARMSKVPFLDNMGYLLTRVTKSNPLLQLVQEVNFAWLAVIILGIGLSDSGRSVKCSKHDLCFVSSSWYFSQLNYANHLQIIYFLLNEERFGNDALPMTSLAFVWWSGHFSHLTSAAPTSCNSACHSIDQRFWIIRWPMLE